MTTADRAANQPQLSPEEQAKQEFLGKLATITHRLREQVARRYSLCELRQSSDYCEWLKVEIGSDGQSETSWLMAGDLVNKKTGSKQEVFVSPDGTAFSSKVVCYSGGGDVWRRVFVQPSSLANREGITFAFVDGLPSLDGKEGIGSGEEYRLENGCQLTLSSCRGHFYGQWLKESMTDQEIQEAVEYFRKTLPLEPVAPQGLRDRVKAFFQR